MDFLQLQRVQSSLGGARVLMQRLLLLQSTSSKYTGFSVLKLHSTWDIPAPKIKPCVGRWTHNQWITREDLYCRLFILAILINKKWCLVVLIGFFLKLVTLKLLYICIQSVIIISYLIVHAIHSSFFSKRLAVFLTAL